MDSDAKRGAAVFWTLAGPAASRGSAASGSNSGSGSIATLPSDSSAFSFDGTTSDIAQQLYWRSKANDSATKITLTSVPDAVVARLSPFGIDFNTDLPGIVQRAVMWDTGFVLAPSGTDALQIWTLNNYSLTDIAVPYDDYSGAGCVALECNSTDLPSYNTSQYCNGAQMLSKARCVIESFEDAGEGGYSMWSNGGDPDMVPHIRVINHQWFDDGSNISYKVYAVHTLSQDVEPEYGTCLATGYGSLVVPCYPSSNTTDLDSNDIHEVIPSPWVTTWLEDYRVADSSGSLGESSSGFRLILLIPIVVGAVVFVACGVLYCNWQRQRRLKGQHPGEDHSSGFYPENETQIQQIGVETLREDPYNAIMTPDKSGESATRFYHSSARPTESTEDTTQTDNTVSGENGTIRIPQGLDFETESGVSGPDQLVQILTSNAFLIGRRIPLEQLQFLKAISKGAYGEVWLCNFNGKQVATKRLLQNKQIKFDDIQDFVHEIQLSASLQHPNIVRVIGVAWNSLYNLSMVIDYLPTGDLQLYLKKQGDLMTWARDKIHIAVGIARALAYLHFRDPVLIHRDLKSKNVLLTRMLDPQLIDFGVSRRRIEETMTAGVGTPYWTAPEVLNGDRYSEQSDIYSFGVLLSELDTCELPYFDAVSPEGSKLKPFQVLDGVMSGVLRPSFSGGCPSRVRRLGVACLQQDPARRPNAQKLVELLGG